MRPVRENIPHGPRGSSAANGGRPTRRVPHLNRRIAGTFQPHLPRVLAIGFLILITAGLGVVNPILIRVVFDSALFPEGGPDMHLLWQLAVAMAAVVVVTGCLGVVQTLLTQRLGQRVMRDLRDRLYTHLQSLSLGFFTSQKTGEIQSRVANDVAGIRVVVTGTVSTILSNIVILISTLIAMSVLSWQLTIVAVGITPLFAVFAYMVGKRRRAASKLVQESTAEMTAITQETLSVSGVMLTRLFGAQHREIERFRDQNVRLSDLEIRREMTGQRVWAGMQIFYSLTPVVVYVLAGYILFGGFGPNGITAGTIVAFTTLQARLYFPISTLLRTSVELQSSLALFERIFGYLDIRPDIVDAPDAVNIPVESVAGHVSLRDVRMNYHPATLLSEAYEVEPEGREFWALDGVNLEVKPGQLAALVGPSGAGKTTVSYLIPRLYDATSGEVSIDGVDVRHIQMESLARMIGYVSQESYLFHASIRENLLYGNPGATEQQLHDAARAAYIHDRIMEFPDGYDTVVGERGYRMSGGERQRLSIARVILHDPRLLILDEATSSLDTTSERYVQAALQPLMKGRTTIAIAHRLSTIMTADVIFVIDRGRVVEQGTHYELVASGGLYAQLYDEQYEGGAVEYVRDDGIAVLASGNLRLPVPL